MTRRKHCPHGNPTIGGCKQCKKEENKRRYETRVNHGELKQLRLDALTRAAKVLEKAIRGW